MTTDVFSYYNDIIVPTEQTESDDSLLIIKYYMNDGKEDLNKLQDFIFKYITIIHNPAHPDANEYLSRMKEYIMKDYLIPLYAKELLEIMILHNVITSYEINDIYNKLKIERKILNSPFSEKLRSQGYDFHNGIYYKFATDKEIEDYAYNQAYFLDEIMDSIRELAFPANAGVAFGLYRND